MAALQELDAVSTRNPGVLSRFPDHLNKMLLSELEGCRQLSFNLILRHMTYSPCKLLIIYKVNFLRIRLKWLIVF